MGMGVAGVLFGNYMEGNLDEMLWKSSVTAAASTTTTVARGQTSTSVGGKKVETQEEVAGSKFDKTATVQDIVEGEVFLVNSDHNKHEMERSENIDQEVKVESPTSCGAIEAANVSRSTWKTEGPATLSKVRMVFWATLRLSQILLSFLLPTSLIFLRFM